MSNEFIDSFNIMRTFLREIFIYGCYTRDDFISKEMCARKYDQEKSRLLMFQKKYNCNDVVVENQKGKKKVVSMYYNMFKTTYNYLADYYFIKSYTPIRAELYIKCLQVLTLRGRRNRLNIFTDINYYQDSCSFKENGDCNNKFSEQSLYRALKDMTKHGILKSEKISGEYYFSIQEDIFSQLSETEFENLNLALQFFTATIYPITPGYFLIDTIKSYIKSKKLLYNEQELFLFKHNHFQHAIEDEILWDVLNAMNESKYISFDYTPLNCDCISIKNSIPVKIIADDKYGRRYLFSLDSQNKSPKLYRLDRMSKLTVKHKSNENREIMEDTYIRFMKYSWGGVVPLNEDKGLIQVELLFDLNNLDIYMKSRILNRINSEGKWGILEKSDTDEYKFSIYITDPIEMKPWIRSFGRIVKVEKSDYHNLSEEMEQEYIQWRLMYEDV